ncbi:MAG: hypothetical protein P8J87_02190, partial [Verrucomicrobiales bacterium]|nr:hypothetical protein [Verrucomicrobiales bacterium]
MTLDVEVQETLTADDGRTLVSASEWATVSLVDGRGGAFEMPEAFDFLPGSQLRVTGFDDLAGPTGPRVIGVISAEVTMLAQPGASDVDGNLLEDSWELIFFGRNGLDTGSSADGSGFSLSH